MTGGAAATAAARPRAGAARQAWRDYALVYAAGVIVYGALALWAGQDINWDLQNYHDYAAYALLHWRYPIDVAPGGPQSYLNPLPYLLPYLLRHHAPMRVGAVLVAAMQAALPAVLWALAGRMVPAGTAGRRPLRALMTVAGSTGAMTLSEIGTSFADLLLALPCLGALTLLLAADGAAGQRRAWMLAGAGFLAGAACGLKLTNLVTALALGLAAVLPWRRGARALPAALATAGVLLVSGLAGFAVSDGWWAAFLWTSFGSPTFPFLNGLFRAPSAVAMNFTDPRFLPHGWWDALTYPWQIAAGRARTAEVPFADPRLLAGLAAALVTLFALVTPAGRAACRASPGGARVAVFVLAATALWLPSFGIQRYVMAPEAAAAALAVVTAWRIGAHLFRAVRTGGRRAAAGLITAAVATGVLLAATRPADWRHRPWAMRWTGHPPAEALSADAYVLLAPPLGYWASYLSRAAPLYELDPDLLNPGGALARRVDDGLRRAAAGAGGIWAIGQGGPIPEAVRAAMRARGLILRPDCVRVPAMDDMAVFCRAELTGPRRSAASTLAAEEVARFTDDGSGWVYEAEGFALAERTGTWATGPVARLVLWPRTAGSTPAAAALRGTPSAAPVVPGPGRADRSARQSLAIDLDMAALPGAATQLAVLVNGRNAAPIVLPSDGAMRRVRLCVPSTMAAPDGVLDLVFVNPQAHSPASLGRGQDIRALSFLLASMSVAAAAECPPAPGTP